MISYKKAKKMTELPFRHWVLDIITGKESLGKENIQKYREAAKKGICRFSG